MKNFLECFAGVLFAFLIGAGCVQFSISTDTKLTDLITSAATVVAVVIAWIGVGTWKKELILSNSLKSIEEMLLLMHRVEPTLDKMVVLINLEDIAWNKDELEKHNEELKLVLDKSKVLTALLDKRSIISAQDKVGYINALTRTTTSIDSLVNIQQVDQYKRARENMNNLYKKNDEVIEKLTAKIT